MPRCEPGARLTVSRPQHRAVEGLLGRALDLSPLVLNILADCFQLVVTQMSFFLIISFVFVAVHHKRKKKL